MTGVQTCALPIYNFDNELFKVIEIKSVHPLSDGKYLVKEMIAENLITGRKSQIIFSNINIGAKVDDSLFSLQNLERQ